MKVPRTYLAFGEDEDVSCGKVAVDKSFTLQVAHAIAHLLCKVTQARDGEVKAQRRLFQTLDQRPHGCKLCHLERSYTVSWVVGCKHSTVAGWL